MVENGTVSGAKPKVGWFPIEVLRRQNGSFSSYPSGTWRILPLNAWKILVVGGHHVGLSSCSGTKSGSRHARNLIEFRP